MATKGYKIKIPTAAQAKLIARAFALDETIHGPHPTKPGYHFPTTKAVIREGWFADTGTEYIGPSGSHFYHVYAVTPAGLLALECFLNRLRTY